MARADRPLLSAPRRRPLNLLMSSLYGGLFCGLGAMAQTAPPAGSPSDVAYTPVQGLSSPLYPRQEADARVGTDYRSAVGRIVLDASENGLPADGVSVVRLTLRLFDRKDQALSGNTRVTLEHSGGRIRLNGARSDEMGPRALDADPAEPGIQIDVRDGVAELELIAPSEAQDVRVRVTAGPAMVLGQISFVPDLRPMIYLPDLQVLDARLHGL